VNEGDYEFVATDKGWDLRRDTIESTGNTLSPVVRRNQLPTQR
jgi:hypothetical protein